MNLNAIKARLVGMYQHLGWPVLLAPTLLVVGGLLYTLTVKPLERERDFLKDKLHNTSQRRVDLELQRTAARTPAAKLAAFYAFFVTSEEATDYLARLYGLAEKLGIELRTADYRLVEPHGAKLYEYVVTLPVSGNYAQIRAFLENALLAVPVLTLDQVSFRRKKTGDLAVDAELRFTLFLSRP